MLSNITYYELLDCPVNATAEEIKQLYEKKIFELATQKVTDLEMYQTAYYILSDATRRKKYDDSIGLLHKHKIPLLKRIMVILGRIICTLLDVLYELLLSFIIMLILVLIGYGIYTVYKSGTLSFANYQYLYNKIDTIYKYIIISGLIAVIPLFILRPKIRYINRKLKHELRKYE